MSSSSSPEKKKDDQVVVEVAGEGLVGDGDNAANANERKKPPKKVKQQRRRSSTNGNQEKDKDKGKKRVSMTKKTGKEKEIPAKRRKKAEKDANAPRLPLSGYVLFLNKSRARVKLANPEASFAELTKLIAMEWQNMTPEEKKDYLGEADDDRKRYQKQLEAYQQTDQYKMFVERKKAAKKQKKEDEQQSKEALTVPVKGLPKKTVASRDGGQRQMGGQHNESTTAVGGVPSLLTSSFDIPIFTEEFLDHNRSRESDLRQLRKLTTEFEEQNAILGKHIENMKSAGEKLETESVQRTKNGEALNQHLQQVKELLVDCFRGLRVPGMDEEPEANEVDCYLKKLVSILNKDKNSAQSSASHSILAKIHAIFDSVDFNALKRKKA